MSRFVSNAGSSARLWLLMGTVQSELKHSIESRQAHRNAWQSAQGDQVPTIGNGIAWAFWTQRADLSDDDKRFALRVSTKATREFEKTNFDPVARAMYYDTLACCHYMNGNRWKAIELMERCVEADPSFTEYAERLAEFEAHG